jgi:hypothetical protein
MDDIVKAAMAKWPNVPDCHGWLGLDDRGQWWMRDERAQAAGAFQSPASHPCAQQARGTRLQHEKLVAFIARNYGRDEHGCWFFQNGPQRVYVELMRAPWVCRVHPGGHEWVTLHTGEQARVQVVWLDDEGLLYVQTPQGLALVHSQDMGAAADLLEASLWQAAECRSDQLEARFGHVLSPAQQKTPRA